MLDFITRGAVVSGKRYPNFNKRRLTLKKIPSYVPVHPQASALVLILFLIQGGRRSCHHLRLEAEAVAHGVVRSRRALVSLNSGVADVQHISGHVQDVLPQQQGDEEDGSFFIEEEHSLECN